eukprot:TRINITY_DN4702_c0_g1_i4.p1 TRINITY_DN4702_c0_g1~~TRINITY_DN4702_c0_g1_i4.p1  ORF type:complete len:379 (+),score=52.84 TRINITY_DN4702_c0_g1_i4:140-1138(+)
MCIRDRYQRRVRGLAKAAMGNDISNELGTSLGLDFISRELCQVTRCQMAMTSMRVWAAVESARAAGACIRRQAVRARMPENCSSCYGEQLVGWSGEWMMIGSLSRRRRFHSCAAIGSLLCVIGGTFDYHGRKSPTGLVDVLDTVSANWDTVAPLPTPRFGPSCAVVGNLLYVIGGDSDAMNNSPMDSVEVLDTTSGIWSTGPSMPRARCNHQSAVVGSLLYVLGGNDTDDDLLSVDVLDLESGVWSTGPPLSSPRYHHTCVVVGRLLYAIGGNNGFHPLDSVVLDTVCGVWSTLDVDAWRPSVELMCEYEEQPCAWYSKLSLIHISEPTRPY